MFNWFYDLNTKVKLTLVSGLLIIIIISGACMSFISTMQSINASEHIETIVNRSFGRITTLQKAMEKYDRITISYLSAEKVTPADTSKYLDEAGAAIRKVVEAANIMNPKKVGDLDSSPEYERIIADYKKEGVKLADYHKEIRTLVESSTRNVALIKYLRVYRPEVMNALQYTADAARLQTRLVVSLARQGSDPTLAYISLIVPLIGAFIGGIFAYMTNFFLGRTIFHLDNYISKMSHGDFTFKVDKYFKDDFGKILQYIESMRADLRTALNEVKKKSEDTQEAMRQVIETTGIITDKIADCEGKSITVSAASEQMLSTTQDIAHNCEDASNLSHSTKAIIDEGVERINATISSIRKQSEEIRANSEAVDKVAKRSMDINSIVNTIEEIAAQTNLLALNAAIEAARAGEAGRGFAVVADEVRALASRTSASTKEIADMVQGIQMDAATAVRSINQSVTNMEATSEETAEVESTMRNMLEHVNNVNMQITQIASAAEEQSAATNEISTHIHGISGLTREVNQNAQDAKVIIDDTVKSMKNLRESLSFFKTL
ncbi:methyl-accepting chemotaxis protein [Anaerobiospirillum succiniciproducens]|uniref:methyl-accepting chemotaxis protein n=1 Tax=Anaerobiospirillum succiniciproducens TaxID=13335 RepID=UPI0004218623|nr:methyl-accepting chemotaxis protein [Anaerobiospirillum succiniciproducens]